MYMKQPMSRPCSGSHADEVYATRKRSSCCMLPG
ncbi:hypothetical protein ERO13_A02G013801v2 [Gossypium hirsutum]|uniref:Uncharacterized protein n=1 Tax=Gossypium darwinii TaxID=34276 RepID=A0A5D2H904_GOSDA|nr:hypothetical protein ERO13_A02G013801v2 [Gossypium hirsutum]TYH26785.1 hypothetical protein ES288_A02G016400v1 [Gossypium darwinii]